MTTSLFSSIKFNHSNLNLAHSDSSSSTSFKIRNDEISTSKGITTSIPYAKEYGVEFVEVLIVVQYICSMYKIISC